jgi:hypothetical protein
MAWTKTPCFDTPTFSFCFFCRLVSVFPFICLFEHLCPLMSLNSSSVRLTNHLTVFPSVYIPSFLYICLSWLFDFSLHNFAVSLIHCLLTTCISVYFFKYILFVCSYISLFFAYLKEPKKSKYQWKKNMTKLERSEVVFLFRFFCRCIYFRFCCCWKMWRQSNKTKATFLISYVIHETLLYFDLIEYNFVKNKKILLWLREFSDLCGLNFTNRSNTKLCRLNCKNCQNFQVCFLEF